MHFFCMHEKIPESRKIIMSGIGEWEAFMWEADDTIVTAAGAPVHVPAPVPVQEAARRMFQEEFLSYEDEEKQDAEKIV